VTEAHPRPLRVAFNATTLGGPRTGVPSYIVALLREMGGRPADVALRVLARREEAAEITGLAPSLDVDGVRLRTRPIRVAWEHWMMGGRIQRGDPEAVHGPHYTLPRGLRVPGVVTFHDPTFFTMPEVHERAKVAYFGRMAREGVGRAARVIAVSSYARSGAIEHAGADPARVDVVPMGLDHAVYRPAVDADEEERDAALRRAVGAEGPYVLWVGAIEPRKDVPTLVAAFAGLPPADGLRLVLGGPPAWGADAVDAAIARHRVADRVIRPGFVSEATKVALLRGAAVFAYPSLAEGFGMQIPEAMACGTPVVTTTGSATEEVGGGAAALIAPRDVDGLAATLARILEDPTVAADLRDRGLRRARDFSWSATADGTIATYRAAAGREGTG
jgi:glycosyltransferase involved in cell wall biosynthesis